MPFFPPFPTTIPAPSSSFGSRRVPFVLAVLTAAAGLLACGGPEEAVDLDLLRARNAVQLEQPAWSRLYFARDLEANPGRVESVRGLALATSRGPEASLSVAAELLEDFLVAQPNDVEVRNQLARTYLLLGEMDGARRALASTQTSERSAQRELVEPGGHQKAESEAESVLLLARALMDETPGEAARLLDDYLPSPSAAQARWHVSFVPLAVEAARAALRLGDAERALAWAERANELDPLRVDGPFLRARSLQQLGQDAEAAAAFEHYQDLRGVTTSLSEGTAYDGAALERIEQEFADDKSVLARVEVLRCRLWLVSRQFDRVRPCLERVVSIPVGSPGEILSGMLFNLADRVQQAGLGDLTEPLYRRVLELDPEHAMAGVQLARLLHARGDIDGAEGQLASSLERSLDFGPVRHAAGLVALSRGDEVGARRHFELAVELTPWIVAHRLTLADVLLTAGERERAIELLDAAPVPHPAIHAFKKRRGFP